MVFQTLINLAKQARQGSPNSFWRKRKIFKIAAVNMIQLSIQKFRDKKFISMCLFVSFQHFTGRRRNCYSVTIRNVDRALVYATKARKLKKEDLHEVM